MTELREAMSTIDRSPQAWAREFTSDDVWRHEQDRMGHRAWTLLGLTRDVSGDGDWITATLAGKSVFVQRAGSRLGGFENVCAHRFYPLRIGKRGNGPIRCGFHGWLYNADGTAVGIPICEEMFGRSRREIDRRLDKIDVETCGGLIFGRLSGPGTDRSDLSAYLGDMAPALAALTDGTAECLAEIDQTTAANWKLCYQITLDDYHLPTVHPDSFGNAGYLKPNTYRYFASGRHSAMFTGLFVPKAEFARWIDACRNGVLDDKFYRIVQIFPNLVVALFPYEGNWFVCVSRYLARSATETQVRSWILAAPIADTVAGKPQVRVGALDYIGRILREDSAVAEHLQSIAVQISKPPLLSRQEQRVAWFDQAYAAFMADPGE
ncbi:MAG: rieske (2Fe-2S) domain protein [Rhodospirillales bacterium]|nr:rieske (2Fe-2S) domain protein [Rhodospirillales bacterium]